MQNPQELTVNLEELINFSWADDVSTGEVDDEFHEKSLIWLEETSSTYKSVVPTQEGCKPTHLNATASQDPAFPDLMFETSEDETSSKYSDSSEGSEDFLQLALPSAVVDKQEVEIPGNINAWVLFAQEQSKLYSRSYCTAGPQHATVLEPTIEQRKEKTVSNTSNLSKESEYTTNLISPFEVAVRENNPGSTKSWALFAQEETRLYYQTHCSTGSLDPTFPEPVIEHSEDRASSQSSDPTEENEDTKELTLPFEKATKVEEYPGSIKEWALFAQEQLK